VNNPSEARLLWKVKAAFAVALLLTGLLGLLSWRSAQQGAQDAQSVAHTHQVSTELELAIRHIVDAETGARGFALTGRDGFLEPYESGKIATGLDLQKLRTLIVDPNQKQRLNVLTEQTTAQLAAAAELVATRQNTSKIPTVDQVQRGKETMDAVRVTIDAMEAREQQLLEQRSETVHATRHYTSLMISLGSVLGVIFLSIAGASVSREIGISDRARRQVTFLNADLERRVEQRTAALESEIAARVETDVRLQASEEMFRMLLDGIRDYAVYMLDVEGRVASWNSGAARIMGYHAPEIIGENVSCFYTETDRARNLPQETLREAAHAGRFEGQGWRVRKDGSKFWANAVITPMYEANGALRGYSKVVRDITNRKRAEDELKKQAALLELAHDAIFVRDLQSRVVFWNRGAEHLYGRSAEEACGRVTHELLQTRFPLPLADIEAILANKGEWEGELRHITRQGTEVVVASRWSIQRDEFGAPAAILEINRDITDRKRAETALSESEGRLAGVIASAMDAIITVDDEQHIVLFNRAAEKMLRCPEGEAIGQPITHFIPQRFHGAHAGHIHSFAETGVTNRAMGPRNVLWATRADGQEFQIEASISQVVTGGKKLFTVILRDVTERVKAEAVREHLAAVVHSSDDAIISKDLNGTINAWNRGAEKIFGYSPAEAMGKPMLMLFPSDRINEEPDILERIRSGESVEHFETIRVRKDGTKIDVSVAISPIRDQAGTIVGASKIARDITERKRGEEHMAQQAVELSKSQQALETQQLMLQSVLDSMGEGLVAADDQGKFLIWNPAAARIVGLGGANVPPEEWSSHYGAYLPDTITPFPTEQNPLVRAIRGEVSSAEIFIRHPELEQGVWIESNGAPLRDKNGTLRGGVIAFRDITQKKAAELEIRKLNENLEESIAKRTEQLATANRELESFTYSVSHDLRAPLRHIGAFAGACLEDFGTTLDPQVLHYVQRIQAGVHRMGVLTDELLNLARTGQRPLRLQFTGLNSIVEEIISMLHAETEGREVEWKIGHLPSVECDPVLVRQIFQNLLSNAIKYSRRRPHAVIEVGHIQENGEQIILVRDNGAGFNMQYADKLFGVFQRLHRDEEFEGTGVGLVTVQRIVQKHGGRIWAEAAVDRGATFYFTLARNQFAGARGDAATGGA
jgi:PAS domain S-box-containing protein